MTTEQINIELILNAVDMIFQPAFPRLSIDPIAIAAELHITGDYQAELLQEELLHQPSVTRRFDA